MGGGATSMFPIDLHMGDNGDVGIFLYNYIVQHHQSGYYIFKENEIVTYNNTKIEYFGYNDYNCYADFGPERLLLSSSGVITWDGSGGSDA